MPTPAARRAAVLLALGGLAGCAHAGHPASAGPPPGDQRAAAQPAEGARPAPVLVPGSRVPRQAAPAGPATSAARVFEAADLAGTGAPDLAEALRRLEPSAR